MKTRVKGILMIDCGSVTRGTRGLPAGVFLEGAPFPFNLTIFH
jgi:hypothetical protein